jgi:2-oxoglutarate ferredoxin oxidoreductase subunit alpha
MATQETALGIEQGLRHAQGRVTNDFSINVATVNGSGSQSANGVLLKSIFGMGVPFISVEHCRIAHLVYDSRQQG